MITQVPAQRKILLQEIFIGSAPGLCPRDDLEAVDLSSSIFLRIEGYECKVEPFRGFVFFRRIFRERNADGGSFAGAQRRFRAVDVRRGPRLRRQQRHLRSHRPGLTTKRFPG